VRQTCGLRLVLVLGGSQVDLLNCLIYTDRPHRRDRCSGRAPTSADGLSNFASRRSRSTISVLSRARSCKFSALLKLHRHRSLAASLRREYDRCSMTIPVPTTRKRGNQSWGRPIPTAPALPTEFELRVTQLRLTADGYTSSTELRTWCQQNRKRCYIPGWLLEEWGIAGD
jgi:hypothetical protein